VYACGCGAAGLSNHSLRIYLSVDRATSAGSFDATTTRMVMSG
jgi:hypothetical protein